MPTIDRLRASRREVWAEAKQLADTAAAGNRNFTAAEQDDYERLSARLDHLDERIGTVQAAGQHRAETEDAFRRIMGGPAGPTPGGTAETREAFGQLHEAAQSSTSRAVDVARRDFLAATLPPALGGLYGGDYQDTPSVMDLFTPQALESPVVRAYRVDTSASAGQVAEGATKPDAGITLDHEDVAAQKIASVIKVSDELKQDAPSFITTLQGELSRAVVDEENSYAISRILAANLATASGSSVIDGVADAIASLATTSGVAADGVVLNPADLAAVRKAKADTAGTYQVDPQTSAPNALHGLRLVATPKVDAGTVLVGRFATAGTGYVRDNLRVDVGLDGSDFMSNLFTMRAEERVALAVVRPAHLVKLTVSA